MLLADVVSASARVAATRSRTAKTEVVADVLRAAAPEEVALVTAYLAGVLPQRRVGVGWRGLGSLPGSADEPTLTVTEVDRLLQGLADASGPGSVAARAALVADLFGAATVDEQAFLRGLISGELRQGAQDGVMQAAIAEAAEVPATLVRRAVMLAGFSAPVAEAAMSGGAQALEAVSLEVGRPLRPMLAGSEPTVAEALSTVAPQGDSVAIDCKLDGIRVQAHKDGDDVRLFTRSLEDVTDRLPEVVDVVRAMRADRLVLDGEVIALRADGTPHPFQVTGARTASSKDPDELRRTTPVTPWFFDVLHRDGTDLIDVPSSERTAVLGDVVPAAHVVPRLETDDSRAAQVFFDAWVGRGHEGVVVKSLTAPYAAGRRGAGWVKVKPRHTLDLVVLAVEWGSGRRQGTLSNIHLGARDPESGGFVMLGKTFKGMTDEILAWQTQRFSELATDRGDWVVTVRPEQVVEIAFDGVQRSSRYPGGMALRFARVLRYRNDKTAEEADTVDDVRGLLQ